MLRPARSSSVSGMTTGETTTVEARPLPRGPHRLARETVIESQRGRMIAAIAEAVADKGYAATTVGDVVSGAGVSRKTFYEHFSDKEDCFLAAWDTGVQVLFDAILSARDRETDPIERMRAGLRAYLTTLAAEPAFARSFFIEVVAAGPRAEARRAQGDQRFAELFAPIPRQGPRGKPPGPPRPPAGSRGGGRGGQQAGPPLRR